VSVLNYVNATSVLATAAQGNASIRVNGVLVQSGSWSGGIELVEGTNGVEVEVTAEDGVSTRKYVVEVLRRTAIDGGYDGLVLPGVGSVDPRQHVGVASVSMGSTGYFSGRVTFGGTSASVAFSGLADASGTLNFSVSGSSVRTPVLSVVRAGSDPLMVGMRVDWQTPLTHQLVGEVRSGSLVVSEFVLNRRLYTSATAPVAPSRNVPVTVLDSATDKGAYTMVLPARDAALQGREANTYPQGSGWATAVVSPAGLVTVTGELADGQVFSASNYLSKENRLPFYVMPYGGGGVVSGEVSFHDVPGKSDVDGGAGLRWYKPANAGDALYAEGWPAGIGLDLVGSKFLGASVTTKTVLGNEAAAYPAVNGLSELSLGGLDRVLSNCLTVGRTSVRAQGAPLGGTGALSEMISLGSTGRVLGSFVYPGSTGGTLGVAFRGAVLQKTQSAGGYFILPAVGEKPAESGVLRVSAQ